MVCLLLTIHSQFMVIGLRIAKTSWLIWKSMKSIVTIIHTRTMSMFAPTFPKILILTTTFRPFSKPWMSTCLGESQLMIWICNSSRYTLNAEIVQEYEGHHLTVNAATAPSCPPGYSGDALYDVCAPYSSGYDSQKFNCLYVPCDFGGIEP